MILQLVVKLLNRECVDLLMITLVIYEIIFWAHRFECVSWSFCKRARNYIAHRLAQVAVRLEGVVELCEFSFVEDDVMCCFGDFLRWLSFALIEDSLFSKLGSSCWVPWLLLFLFIKKMHKKPIKKPILKGLKWQMIQLLKKNVKWPCHGYVKLRYYPSFSWYFSPFS